MFRRADQPRSAVLGTTQCEIGTVTFSADLGSTEVVKVARLSRSALAGCGRTNPRGKEKTVFGTRDAFALFYSHMALGTPANTPSDSPESRDGREKCCTIYHLLRKLVHNKITPT